MAQIIQWKMCDKYNLEKGSKWYEHKPQPVLESDDIKLLWDFTIQTDHQVAHNKPDIVILNKKVKACTIVDIACPFDTRVDTKEKEKVEKYQDLKREIARIWKCECVNIVPVVVGALGTLPKNYKRWLEKIEPANSVDLLQKACLLGSARILRKVLDM